MGSGSASSTRPVLRESPLPAQTAALPDHRSVHHARSASTPLGQSVCPTEAACPPPKKSPQIHLDRVRERRDTDY